MVASHLSDTVEWRRLHSIFIDRITETARFGALQMSAAKNIKTQHQKIIIIIIIINNNK
jgi:hypothetical protein